jgi:hypothetical protein
MSDSSPLDFSGDTPPPGGEKPQLGVLGRAFCSDLDPVPQARLVGRDEWVEAFCSPAITDAKWLSFHVLREIDEASAHAERHQRSHVVDGLAAIATRWRLFPERIAEVVRTECSEGWDRFAADREDFRLPMPGVVDCPQLSDILGFSTSDIIPFSTEAVLLAINRKVRDLETQVPVEPAAIIGVVREEFATQFAQLAKAIAPKQPQDKYLDCEIDAGRFEIHRNGKTAKFTQPKPFRLVGALLEVGEAGIDRTALENVLFDGEARTPNALDQHKSKAAASLSVIKLEIESGRNWKIIAIG